MTNFQQRAIKNCVESMKKRIISPSLVRNILKYKNSINVEDIEPFLYDKHSMIQKAAIEIIGTCGRIEKVIELLKTAHQDLDLGNILYILRILPEKAIHLKDTIDDLCFLLNYPEETLRETIKENAIIFFRRMQRADCLVGLLFDSDESIVYRVKNYIEKEEKDKNGQTNL
jgi:hypothetical protein